MKARDDKPHINRAEKHINGFIRVFVSLADGVEFPMLVDRSMTMEYVARQVEAELWALRTPRKPLDAPDDWKASMEQLIAVYQLYDIAQVAYPFDGIAADCLKFDDQITPLTSLEDSFPEEDDLFLLSNSAFELNTDKTNNTLQASTAEERLHSILTNTCSLQFFLQFSLAEYSVENSLFWIEIELFRSLVSAQDRIIFDRHIRNTFIEKNAPLALNIDEETRNTNLHQSGSLDGKKYDELQDFIFLLIKTHGYSRFQNSLLFQKFLEFRDKDRYAYTQGKTAWNFEALEEFESKREQMVLMSYDIEEFTKTNATPLDTYKFRENILQLEMSIFVPKKLKVNQGYFNTSERAESMLKGRKLAKQRKLQDFFGFQLSQSDLRDQAIENYPTISLDSFASAGIDIQELKKKNGKLRNFFGSPTPGIPRAALVPKISSESIQSAVDKNELHKEIKSARTKKAKKLSLLLGNPISGLHLIEQLPPVTSHGNLIEELGSIMLSPDVGKSMDSINPQLAIKKIQQARLEKLSQVLGHRILAEQLVTSTSSTQSEHPRPLTQFEREVYKKKAEKLGRIFGTAVSVNDIIDYSKLLVKEPSSLNSIQSEKSATSSIAPEPVKVSQVNKVRKIYKILGSWPSLKSELSDREEFESGGTS